MSDYDNPDVEPVPNAPTVDLTPILEGDVDVDLLYHGVYVYQLLDHEGVPWYVGTTTNPAARLVGHLRGETKDTATVIRGMRERGQAPTMRLVDLTVPDNRITIEALWIDRTPGAVNTTRYTDHLRRFNACPSCYRSLHH